ncbi:hypothetical protein ACH46F_23515 [Streptomyces virginiae]|uniref:hypothetical protein n=1 Tax=Streptomyces virginiae TaxID=1961 RepID=UPI003788B290
MVGRKKSGGGTDRRRVSTIVDIEGYSKRTYPEQLELQERLDWVMGNALRAAGLDTRNCYRQEHGDALLFVLPDSISEITVVPALISGVQTALHEVNRVPGRDTRRMRMRMALGQGSTTSGATGAVGQGLVLVTDLVGSEPARRALTAHKDCDLAFISDESYFRDVLSQGIDGLPAGANSMDHVVNKRSSGPPEIAVWVAAFPVARTNTRIPVFTPGSSGSLASDSAYLVDPRVLAGGAALAGLAAGRLSKRPPAKPDTVPPPAPAVAPASWQGSVPLPATGRLPGVPDLNLPRVPETWELPAADEAGDGNQQGYEDRGDGQEHTEEWDPDREADDDGDDDGHGEGSDEEEDVDWDLDEGGDDTAHGDETDFGDVGGGLDASFPY